MDLQKHGLYIGGVAKTTKTAFLEPDRKKTGSKPLSGVSFGRPLVSFGFPWGLFGLPWGPFGLPWASPGVPLGSLGAPRGAFLVGPISQARLWGSRVPSGSVLGGFGVPPGPVLGGFGVDFRAKS